MVTPVDYTKRMVELIEVAGGTVENDLFVTRPGCLLIANTILTGAGKDLVERLHILDRPEYEQMAELNARLTYLSFRREGEPGDLYLHKLAREHQHLSVFSQATATFLLAGVSVETSMELIAHGEAKVARLTTSKTRAMDHPLFRLQGSAASQAAQRRQIQSALDAMVGSKPEEREFANINNPGSKATALTYAMNLKDYHTLFIGRLPEAGNETEVREICYRMCQQLHAIYPLVIRHPDEYAAMGNGDKYGS